MKRWRDWIIIGLGVFIAGRMGVNVWKLYKAGDKVEVARKTLAEAQAEQEKLKAQLEYVQSDEFVEREAREKLGLGKPGETVVIVPSAPPVPSVSQSGGESNWRKWWKLYAGI